MHSFEIFREKIDGREKEPSPPNGALSESFEFIDLCYIMGCFSALVVFCLAGVLKGAGFYVCDVILISNDINDG